MLQSKLKGNQEGTIFFFKPHGGHESSKQLRGKKVQEKGFYACFRNKMYRGTPFPSHAHGDKSVADSQINLLKRALLHQREGY